MAFLRTTFRNTGMSRSPTVTAEQRFRQLKRWLRQRFPVLHPVRIRRIPAKQLANYMVSVWGVSLYDTSPNRGTILLDRQLNRYQLQDVLIHEWAHQRIWCLPEPADGLAPGKIDSEDVRVSVEEHLIRVAWYAYDQEGSCLANQLPAAAPSRLPTSSYSRKSAGYRRRSGS